MENQCLVLLLCITGAMAACGIPDVTSTATGGMVGDTIELTCGFDRSSSRLQWDFTDLAGDTETVYDDTDGPVTGYTVEELTENNVDYYNLQISSAANDKAGKYTCKCSGTTNTDSKDVEMVLISEIQINDGNDVMIADEDFLVNCSVTYAASRGLTDSVNEGRVTITMEDSEGATVTESEEEELFDVDNTDNIAWRKEAFGRHVFEYTDDGEDFTCHVTVGDDVITNSTRTLTVWHEAANFSLSPVDDIYYREEMVTVLYSANPEPHTKQFWVWFNNQWQLVDEEENTENSFVVSPEWPDSVVLRVDMISRFTGEDEDRNSSWTEPLAIVDCCRTDDAHHMTYSLLMTSLLVMLVSMVTSS